MKRGPIILVSGGVLLIVALMLMPHSPELESSTTMTESHKHENEEASAGSLSIADSLVDDALGKLESGELPPMQAVLTIRDVSERFPENVKANFTLGVMSMQTGQYSKAIERFDKVLAVDNQNPDAHLLLARSRVFIGDTAAATAGLNEALEVLSDEEIKNAIREELASINPN